MPSHVRTLLETDRVWCAYALADLFFPYAAHAEWHTRTEAVLLCYRGFTPPVLFAHGDPQGVGDLLEEIRPGAYQYALLGTHRALVGRRLTSYRESRMWRMVLRPEALVEQPPGAMARLGPKDAHKIAALFAGQPDLPDAYDPSQLESGCFFGVWEGSQLAAMAGTHVVSSQARVAAIGNVYTRRDRRGRGLARRTTGAVAAELLRLGIETIVLNVAMDNAPALSVYRALGFMPFCGYYEGSGELAPPGPLKES